MTRLTLSWKVIASLGSVLALALPAAVTADRLPTNLSFFTLVTTELVVEGLTGDSAGNLHAPGRQPGAGNPCPIYSVNVASPNPEVVTVGKIVREDGSECSPSGLTFNTAGALFIADGDKIYTLIPNAANPPIATVFAEGILGTNGVTFDRDGNLWTGDGTRGNGLVWKISPDGVVTEVFRIQPMFNSLGVGREAHTLPPDRAQNLVANGLIFDRRGDLLVADTARGAIWRVQFDPHGNLRSEVGCDTTFTANTLCLDNIMVAHPLLEGADGIDLDRSGNIWVSANERNAVIVVSGNGDKVVEVFRNPPDEETKLRNQGPLESPTSPFVLDRHICTANSDGNRRDNFPNTTDDPNVPVGEIGGPGQDKGKISCASLRH